MAQVNIPFTKKQFLALMKTVYLGNWMANAQRAEGEVKDYKDTENYIFSHASKFGLEKYVEHENSDGDEYYPTMDFEENTDVHVQHDNYDEETFWDELTHRLGDIKFHQKYSLKEQQKMSQEEHFIKNMACVDEVWEQLSKKGLEQLEFKD